MTLFSKKKKLKCGVKKIDTATIFPLKIFGYGAIYKKIPFFTDFCVPKQKKVSGSCTHNFDAADLTNS